MFCKQNRVYRSEYQFWNIQEIIICKDIRKALKKSLKRRLFGADKRFVRWFTKTTLRHLRNQVFTIFQQGQQTADWGCEMCYTDEARAYVWEEMDPISGGVVQQHIHVYNKDIPKYYRTRGQDALYTIKCKKRFDMKKLCPH